jgi:hypothetical protein
MKIESHIGIAAFLQPFLKRDVIPREHSVSLRMSPSVSDEALDVTHALGGGLAFGPAVSTRASQKLPLAIA